MSIRVPLFHIPWDASSAILCLMHHPKNLLKIFIFFFVLLRLSSQSNTS
jgi:hypothetical protein